MVKSKNEPSPPVASNPRSPRVYMGNHNDDDESSLEAPRRARSEAQVAAFEKARAKRAANLAAGGNTPPASPSPAPTAHPPAPPAAPSAPAAPLPAPAAAPVPKPRKARADKGKKRGYLVKGGMGGESPPNEEEWYPPPTRSGYANFVIV
jgi:hypothetical protein